MARKEKVHVLDSTASAAAAGDIPPMLTKEQFGMKLYRLIRDRGWRQSELARRAGLTRDSISQYINGRSYPSQLSLIKLARALGMTPEELLPNASIDATRADPDTSINPVPGRVGVKWLRINKIVTEETAARVYMLITEDAANRK